MNKPIVLAPALRRNIWLILTLMLAARLLCAAVIPLADTAEPRYAELARKMAETGDWITPQHEYGVPFWGKPPLSTWAAALSIKLFGANEFAARLPSLLFAIGMLAIVWYWCAQKRGRDFALLACTVLASSGLFFIASGAVMTDPGLAFSTTLAMVAFWQALHSPKKIWGYLFFAALGIGLLAKGPVVGMLTFLPILPWILVRRNAQQVWRALPWLSGPLLMLAIALPWYLLAEHKTPGFIRYFILGEHFGRFLDPKWGGDLYGNAHQEPPGSIWLYWIMAAFPWSLLLLFNARTLQRRRSEWLRDDDGWVIYLVLWAFASIGFFTAARNIIWTYPLPALPAFAMLSIELWARLRTPEKSATRLAWLSLITPVALSIVALLYMSGHDAELKASKKASVKFYLQQRQSADDGLYYFRRRYYSAEFYSAGRAKVFYESDIPALLANQTVDFLVVKNDELPRLAPLLEGHFEPLRHYKEFVVLREMMPPRK